MKGFKPKPEGFTCSWMGFSAFEGGVAPMAKPVFRQVPNAVPGPVEVSNMVK